MAVGTEGIDYPTLNLDQLDVSQIQLPNSFGYKWFGSI